MRYFIAILIVTIIGGCVGTKCTDVIENYTSTETIVDKIPINVTQPIGTLESDIVERHRKIPLNYSVEGTGSTVAMRPVVTGSNIKLDLARADQNVMAYFFVVLKNTDDIGGNFTFVGRILVVNRTLSKSETVFINPGRTRRVEFEFTITRGQKWDYSIEIIPPKKTITTTELVDDYSTEPKTFVDYKYVKKTVEVVKNRTIKVC